MRAARPRSSAGCPSAASATRTSSVGFYIVNLADLAGFDEGATVDGAALEAAGYIPDQKLPVKILGDGEFAKKLTVVAGKYSHTAHEKITAAGGTAQNLKGEAFAFPKVKKKFVDRNAPAVGKQPKAETSGDGK